MLNIIKRILYYFSVEKCYKDREYDGDAVFGMCGGLAGGDSTTDYLQFQCCDCKYLKITK